MSFTDICKSWPTCEFLSSQICVLTLFAKIKFSRKFPNLQYSYIITQVKNPGTATFFTNRALCYLRLKTWELAIQDCRRALELDRRLIKGHYFMGLALTELNHYEEAISSLNRGKYHAHL